MTHKKTLSGFLSRLTLLLLFCVLFGTQAHASGLDANKSFMPATVLPKEASKLIVELQNSNTVAATNAAFTDVFPTNVFVASTPNATSTCGGTVTHSNGATEGQLTLSGGTVPAGDGINPGKCKVEIDVISPSKGTYINTIPAGDVTATVSGSGIATQQATSATLTALINPFTVRITSDTRSFSSSYIYLKGEDVATMTLTLTNPNAVSLTDVNMDWDFSTLSAGYYAHLIDGTGGGTCGGAVSVTDAGGSSTTYREETDLEYTGGTIPANGSCTITVQLQTRAYANQSYRNYGYGSAAVAPNTFTTAEGATNNNTTGYFYAYWGIDVEKTFDDETLKQVHEISGAATSQLKLKFENLQVVPVTLNLTDIMPTSPGQMTVDSIDSNTCGGTVTTNGGTEITLAGGSLPATPRIDASFTSCEILATVSVLDDGTYTNEIPSGTTGGYHYGSTEASLIKTSGAATIKKERQNESFRTGDENVYIYTISNLSDPTTGEDILNLRLRDNFEVKNISGTTNYGTLLTISQADVKSSTCAGTVFNSTPGDEFFDISGVTVPKGTSCQIKVQVSHKANDEDYAYQAFENIATKTNLADATEEGVVFDTTSSTDNLFGAEVLLQHSQWNAFEMDMDFIPTAVNIGGIARLRYEISVYTYTNPAVENLYFRNTLPTDLTVAANPNFSSTCGGSLNAVPGSNFVEFSDGYMTGNVLTAPIGSYTSRHCWVEVDIQAPLTAGSYSTSIPGESKLTPFADLEATGEKVGEIAPYKYFYKGYSDSATLTVNPVDIGVNKAFLTPVIGGGEPSRVRITIANNTTGAPPLTGVSVTDTFTGSDMYLYSNIDATFTDTSGSDSDGCRNATITGNPGDGSITLSNADVDSGEICRLEFNVTADVGGNHINSIGIGEVTSDQGITNPSAVSATLTVERELNLSKGFSPSHIGPGETAVLTIEVTNSSLSPADYTGAAVALIDEMPAGVDVQSIASNTCGGSVTIGSQNGNDTVELAGGSFPAETACRIKANVTAASTGAYTNTIPVGALQTNEGSTNGSQGEATLNVNEPPTISKSFYRSTIVQGANSTITFQVYNNAAVALTGINFSDTMTNMQLTSPMVIGGTCQSVTYNATAGGNVFEVTGGVVPANSNCSITTQVTSAIAGVHDNTTTGADSDQTGTGPVSNTAQLTVQELPVLSKSFTPSVIQAGTVSTLTFTLTNPNDGVVLLENWPYAFQDHFPTGMTVAATPNTTMTCTGSASLQNDADTGAVFAGDIGVSFQDGEIPANGSCTASVDVTVANPGSYVNTTTAVDTEYLGYFAAATATLTATAGAPPTYDYGDAPTAGTAPSGTGSNNYGEARHEITAGIYLGAATPDADSSYQSSLDAEGDDNDGGNDDDGVSALPILSIADNSYTLPAANISATGDGTLHAWIDFNGDGSFTSGEHTSVGVTAGTLSGDLQWTGLSGLVAGDSFIRLRLTSDSIVTNSGPSIPATDGEVEDYAFTISGLDYGDAPVSGTAPDGSSTNAYGAASHAIQAGIYLGAAEPDTDKTNQPDAAANGDDSDGNDDDDGITLPTLTAGDSNYTIAIGDITATGDGTLHVWIDFDGNGTFDADEYQSTGITAGTPASALSWTPTVAGSPNFNLLGGDTTFARFRFTSDAAVTASTPASAASDGETEDYAITLATPPASPDLPLSCSAVSTAGVAPDGKPDFAFPEGYWAASYYRGTQDNNDQPGNEVFQGEAFWGLGENPVRITVNGTGTTGRWSNTETPTSPLLHHPSYVGNIWTDTNPRYQIDYRSTVQLNGVIRIGGDPGDVVDDLIEIYVNGVREYAYYPGGGAPDPRPTDTVAAVVPVLTGDEVMVRFMNWGYIGGMTFEFEAPGYDCSDAPSAYGSSPSHVSGSDSVIYLGTQVDVDSTDISSADADQDGADDDGITLPTLGAGASTYTIATGDITATGSGTLHAWIDFDGNNTFDADEHTSVLVTGGTAAGALSWTLDGASGNPDFTVAGGSTFARFRFTTDASVTDSTPSSAASNGEVEDYKLDIISLDFGDAPISGTAPDTSSTNNYGAASHIIVSGIQLGTTAPDQDVANQPSPDANGDDNDGTDDEDGITFPSMSPGNTVTIIADVTGTGGYLQGWIDWNGDGDFADTVGGISEQIAIDAQDNVTTVPGRTDDADTTAGQISISVTVPAGATTNDTFARFRWSTTQGLDSTTLATDGEVEDYKVTMAQFDYGDAPVSGTAPDGSSTNAYGEASHTILSSGPYLGAGLPDVDNANQPSSDAGLSGADGDDGDGTDDDDGITLPTLIQGITASITASVSGAGGNLQAWIDFDGNGTFDAAEQIATDLQDGGAGDTDGATDGSITFSVNVPATATTNQTFARFRWSTTAGLDATTAASDGEVEDYAVSIEPVTPFTCGPELYQSAGTTSTVDLMGITITGSGASAATLGTASTYNAIGYNTADNLLYGVGYNSNTLVVVDANGDRFDLGAITGLPAPTNLATQHVAGDINNSGELFLLTSNQLYTVDIATRTVTATQAVTGWLGGSSDIAWNAVDGLLYGVVGPAAFGAEGRLFSIDTTTGAATMIGANDVGKFGALFFDNAGGLYGLDNPTGDLYRINSSDGTRVVIAEGLSPAGNNDGASCRGAPPITAGSIAGTVYEDDDGSDTHASGTEAGIPSVTVNLYFDNGTPGDFSDDTLVGTRDTAGDGSYSFTNVNASAGITYRVEVDTADTDLSATHFIGTTNPLEGLSVTDGGTTTADFGFDPLTALTCDATLYQSAGTTSTVDLMGITITGSGASAATLGTASTYNAIGYNTADNLLYGVGYNSNTLVVVDANGDRFDLGAITGLPAPTNLATQHVAGDINNSGELFLLTSNQLYTVDIATRTVTATQAVTGWLGGSSDIAWNAVDGLLYGVVSPAAFGAEGRLFSIDTTTGAATMIGANDVGKFGALFFDNAGGLYGLDNPTGDLYRINSSDGTRVVIAEGLSPAGNNDGASCRGAPPITAGTISGTVYVDNNGSDTYDSGTENGIGSVTVSLYFDNGTPGNPADDTLLGTRETAADGSYSFSGVNASAGLTYRVEVDTADTDLPSGALIGTTNPLESLTVTDGGTTTADFGFDQLDYGDAPGYADAAHAIDGVTHLGTAPDVDTGTITTNGDASDDANDDGVFTDAGLTSSLQGSTMRPDDSYTLHIPVVGSGNLYAWVDWNGDGDFDDTAEQIADAMAGSTETLTVAFTVPLGTASGNIYARFRFSSDAAAATPAGTANNGEVEDYQIIINNDPTPPSAASPAHCTTTWAPDGSGGYQSTTTQGLVVTATASAGANSSWSFSPNDALNTSGSFSEGTLNGAASLSTVFFWDTSPEDGRNDLASTDGETGTLTFNFSVPVNDPLLHIDRIGGSGGNSAASPQTLSNTGIITPNAANAGVTFTRLAGTTHFLVTANSIQRTPNETLVYGETSSSSSADSTRDTAMGSVEMPGNYSSLALDFAGAGVEGAGADGLEFVLCAHINDYSDAPVSYNDATHIVTPGIGLGTTIDVDTGSLASIDASGDGFDDDGVRLNGTTLQEQQLDNGNAVTLNVNAQGTGRLHGWIDWDGDGVFGNNANEVIVSESASASGTRTITVTPPNNLTPGISYARFRYSTDSAAANPTGAANDGEVEDYRITLSRGFNISGRVFNDLNVNTSSDAAEPGIAGVAVVLYDTANGTCTSTRTNANGDYTFTDVTPGNYQVYEAAGESAPIPQSCNPANAADPAGYLSTVANASAEFTLSNSDLSGINFGDIQPPVFELDNEQTILPNSVALHPHVFTAQSDGSVSFVIAAENKNPATLNWGRQLLLDANCDGQLSSANGDSAMPASISVTAGQQVCVLAKVVSPANASAGAIHVIDIQSDFTYGDGSLLSNDVQIHQDITRSLAGTTTAPPVDPVVDPVGTPDPVSGEGKLSLVKSVWNVSRGIDGSVALPTETLEYTIHYENIGNGPLNELIINDSVPAFTQLVPASMLCTDKPAELPLCAANDSPGGNLSWSWTVNDNLLPGSKGSVSYQVMIE